MIRKRFYHVGKAALTAAFLIMAFLMPCVATIEAEASSVPVTAAGKKAAKKSTKTKVKRKSTFETPDFAFPETVEKDALPHLENAVKTGNGVEALKAAIQVIVARSMVSNSSFDKNVAMLDSLAERLPRPFASLALLLEANYYRSFYNDNRWTYDQRTLPLDSYPDDTSAWSKELFAKKILSLIAGANEDPESARNVPIGEIAPILVNVEEARSVGLSVGDFIVYNSMDLLEELSDFSVAQVIPFRNDGGRKALTPSEKCGELRKTLMAGLFKYRENAGNIPALAVAICRYSEIMENADRVGFLEKWWKKLIDTPDCARILNQYYFSIDNDSDFGGQKMKSLYGGMNEWLAKFPESKFSKAVRYDLDAIGKKSLTVSLPRNTVSGKIIKGRLNAKNLNRAYVLLYSVPESLVTVNSLNLKQFPAQARFIKAIEVEIPGSVPFSTRMDFEIPALEAGYYVAVPSATAKLSSSWRKEVDQWSLGVVNVSDIAIILSSNSGQKGSQRIYVVEAKTQRPVEGADVKVFDNTRNHRLISQGKTNSEGVYVAPEGNYRLRASHGNSVTSQWIDFNFYKNDPRLSVNANLLTDLSIYKPGQDVAFSLVGWTNKEHVNELLRNKAVDVVLRDANRNPVDTLSLSTDELGRCDGKFTLPSDGLLGSYSIYAKFRDYPDKEAGQVSFQVAEYKAPGFFVDIDSDTSASYEIGDVIRFKGSVKTYSGMPLTDVPVSFNIDWQPWWRWWNEGGNASYGGEVTTDSQGDFMIELPTANLKGTRFEKGIYSISVSATSPSGETQTAPDFRFSLGDGLSINPSIPEKMLISGDSLSLKVPVYDMLGHPVVKSVEYAMTDISTGKQLGKGAFRSPLLRLSSGIPSGEYRFVFNIEGDTLKTDATIALYRNDDVKPPYATPLWIPENRIVCREGDKSVEVVVGSGYPGGWILCEISDEKGFIKREWLDSDGKNIKVTADAPAGNERVWMTFSGMHDFDHKISTVELIPESQTRKLEVKAVSFRDNISAGGKETWKFSFKVDGEIRPGIPAMAVMSNKALNALAPFSWNFNVGTGWWNNRSRMSASGINWMNTTAGFGTRLKYQTIPSAVPGWNFYDFSLTSGGNYGRVMIRGARSRGAVFDGESEEILNTVHLTSLKLEEAPVYASASKVRNEVKASADVEAESADEAPAMEPGDAGAGGMNQQEVRPRPVEMPLAFFKPGLVADDEGNVAVEFTTPDFNTTWQFQIVGYTADLLTAGLVKDAVASKPVMVQSNLPRYMRTGDNVTISAILFNNSAETQSLHGEIMVFDPFTGKTIMSSHAGAEDVAPNGNRTITLEFGKVPSDVSALAVKAFAYAGDYADGEQAIVPVLPSSTPVVESVQFYVGPGEGEFSQKLPKFRENANLTLKYCDNPVWECVMALPSISTPQSKNILSLMRAFYANSLALDITAKYPTVREGLEKVLAARQAGDTAVLRSNLQKDGSLKTVSLDNTPWVNNAAAETRRMENLSTLLDQKAGKATAEDILKDIKSLQKSDGGWSWCPGMESSLFMTRQALLHLGMMRHIGCMPEDAEMIARKALAFCDNKTYEDYVKAKKEFSTVDMLGYLYIRSFFNAPDSRKGFNELKTRALKRISEEWKKFSVYDKATAATLLSRSKGYERVAPVILESLRQFASKDEAKGWWFDNLRSGVGGWNKLMTTAQVLEAYAEVEPKAQAVDGIRQWLVLQKETEDWGADSYTVEVIQAILSSGTDWTVASSSPEITLDGKRLDIQSEELLCGQITVNIDPKNASGKTLRLSKTSAGPAWGGVISQYVAPIKEVKAERCENLKIEKKLLVVTDTEAGEVAKEAPIKVGDKVRVTITLTCDKDMNYVALIDNRAACLEPDEQISGYSVNDGLAMYREVRDTKTSFFIGFLPKGVNVITYDCHADRAGEYAVGIASAQSQYSPLQSAHSAGNVMTVKE